MEYVIAIGSVYHKGEATNFRVQIRDILVFCVYGSCNIVVGAKSGDICVAGGRTLRGA